MKEQETQKMRKEITDKGLALTKQKTEIDELQTELGASKEEIARLKSLSTYESKRNESIVDDLEKSVEKKDKKLNELRAELAKIELKLEKQECELKQRQESLDSAHEAKKKAEEEKANEESPDEENTPDSPEEEEGSE